MSPYEFLDLAALDAVPSLTCDLGVAVTPPADLEMHAPDLHVLASERGSLAARCSCWWQHTPTLDGRRLGIIGHYAAVDAASGAAILEHASNLLAAAGCETAVGPMDGTTWRRYRFIVERGLEPVFFLEPDNPDEWPRHWSAAGFSPLTTYLSSINCDLTTADPRTDRVLRRLTASGLAIRPLDPARSNDELTRIFALSLAAFRRNFLYTPISEREFLAQNQAVLPSIRPELILLAERDDRLLGFIFAVPDLQQAARGTAVDTVIMKTLAVDPSTSGLGLGWVLMDLAQRSARQMGFRRAIHALMHETNVSTRLSARSARPIRRYAVFSKPLVR